ncbi:MAG: hypothetical protein FWF59_08880 [Turicibacter sp.]|nr:hypothetical protein [Turicibacter sp.]
MEKTKPGSWPKHGIITVVLKMTSGAGVMIMEGLMGLPRGFLKRHSGFIRRNLKMQRLVLPKAIPLKQSKTLLGWI